MRLRVRQAAADDVYQDLVRIPEKHRDGIPEGRICRIGLANRSTSSILVVVRGQRASEASEIFMDEVTRNKLTVDADSEYDFRLERVGWIRSLLWASRAANPAYRIPAFVAVVSL